MTDKSKNEPLPDMPAGKAEREAADQSTKDGLQAGRADNKNRQQVRQEKTPQGHPNRG